MFAALLAAAVLGTADDPAEVLARAEATAEERAAALSALAEKNKTKPLAELVAAIERADAVYGAALPGLGALLIGWDPVELESVREPLQRLAAGGKSVATRRIALAAWVIADDDVNRPWMKAREHRGPTIDLLPALALLPAEDRLLRASFGLVKDMMFELPHPLNPPEGNRPAALRVACVADPPGPGLEALRSLTAASSGSAPTVGPHPAGLKVPAGPYGLIFSGLVRLPEGGRWAFRLASDEPARLYLDGALRISRDPSKGPPEGSDVELELAAGPHTIELTWAKSGPGASLALLWQPPGARERRPVPAGAFDDPDNLSIRELAIRLMARIPGYGPQKTHAMAGFLRKGEFRDACVEVLKTVPPAEPVMDDVRTVVGELIAQAARTAAAGERASGAFRDAVAVGRAFTPRLEAASSREALKAFEETEEFAGLGTGRKIYLQTCVRCHQAAGEGLVPFVPPLASSPWFDGDADRLIKIALNGATGRLTVLGQGYIDRMPGFDGKLKDADLAAALTYVNNAWGHKGPTISVQRIEEVRKASAHLKGRLWSMQDLLNAHPVKE
jgi:mono/diheme cytochrome c family protein